MSIGNLMTLVVALGIGLTVSYVALVNAILPLLDMVGIGDVPALRSTIRLIPVVFFVVLTSLIVGYIRRKFRGTGL